MRLVFSGSMISHPNLWTIVSAMMLRATPMLMITSQMIPSISTYVMADIDGTSLTVLMMASCSSNDMVFGLISWIIFLIFILAAEEISINCLKVMSAFFSMRSLTGL